MPPDYSFEQAALTLGALRIAGVDEAGRGPLAGPVTAAAVILDPACIPEGLDDSKKLTALAREKLFARLLDCAEIGTGLATVAEIDELNILRASHLAMIRALAALPRPADHALIDGNLLPRGLTLRCEAVIGGDGRALSIAAATIVAKVMRDRIMVDLAQQHPGYGWESNKGYGAELHLSALESLGVTPHHRRSFKPVYNILCRVNSISS